MMTGRFPVRSGTQVLANDPNGGLTRWEITIPEMLGKIGYVSALFGKWHLGVAPERHPTEQGFAEWYGILRSNEEALWTTSLGYDPKEVPPPYLMEGRRGEKSKPIAVYDVEMRSKFDGEITRRSIDFIKRQAQAGKPFFLYAAMTTGHYPTIPSPEWKGRTGYGPWGDVLAQLDSYVGQLLDTVREAGIENNTIFIFTADNGVDLWARTWAGPWRGNMATAMEGGLRVPFLIRWPGKIPAGRESDEIVHLVDIFPTFAKISGGEVPTDRAIDGVDQLDFFLGKQEKSNRDFFPIYVWDRFQAVKWKHWKLHFFEQIFGLDAPVQKGKLVDLLVDPLEEEDIGKDNTWVIRAIGNRIDEFQASLKKFPPIPVGTPEPYTPPKR